MIAREPDLPDAIPRRLHIPEIVLGDSRQADDGVHGCADIVGHGREEVGLCPARGFCLFSRDLQALVQVEHIEQVEDEQDQQTGGNHTDQQPVACPDVEIFCRHVAKQSPPDSVVKRGIGKDALLPV